MLLRLNGGCVFDLFSFDLMYFSCASFLPTPRVGVLSSNSPNEMLDGNRPESYSGQTLRKVSLQDRGTDTMIHQSLL